MMNQKQFTRSRLMRKRHCLMMTALVLLLAACQPKVYLMPTPLVIGSGEADPFTTNPALEQTTTVPVLYATNRLPLSTSGVDTYTILPGDKLRLGVADLRIGKEDEAWDKLYLLSTTTATDRRPQLHLERLDEHTAIGPKNDPVDLPQEARQFFESVNMALAESEDKDLTVYVHGANSNVYRATAQAAQYRHFTGRNSVVLAFAWPSAESLFRYGIDVINARKTNPVFARLIEILARNTDARFINILAYSAGAQVASPGLASLGQSVSGESRKRLREQLRLGTIYFAAPDVDLKAFVEHLPHYADLARNVTVSININDFVLSLAEDHHGVSRVGRPNPDELRPEDTQWIVEASNRFGFDIININSEEIPDLDKGAHSFWYDHPWVSSDVLILFLLQLGPAERGLQENYSETGTRYWNFPTDYPARVTAVVRGLKTAPEDN